MKRILFALVLVVVMLVSLVLPASAATGDLSVTAKLNSDGTSFTVQLYAKNNPGVIAIQSSVSYDSNALKLKDVKNGEIFDGIYMTSQKIDVNPYTVIWMEATASEDIKTNGVLATYTFEVLSTAPFGETQIKFNIDETTNYAMQSTNTFNPCSLKVNIKNTGGSQNGQPTQSGNAVVPDSSSESAGSGDALVVQKPADNGNTTATSSVAENSSSLVEETSSNTESNENGEQEENPDNTENSKRGLVTVITIAAVVLAGAVITVVALYFRKKSAKNNR